MPLVSRLAVSIALVAGLVGFGAGPVGAADGWQPRAETYSDVVTENDLEITMSDGTVLRANLTRPVDADGAAVDEPLPVIVTITAYNKNAQQYSPLAGADPTYLVKRGYLHLTVDARGTGSSDGSWCAFCTRENTDAGEVMEWAHAQPWSNGDTGMSGPSYMGISQIFAASAQPAGLKAIFPQVAAADVYRDIVASGGQLDVGFIPLWLGLVTATGVFPPAFLVSDPTSAIGILVDHLIGASSFSAPLLLSAALGDDPAYDGEFYHQRSPINVVDDVTVPTFLIGGEYDLFQRGTPLLFERLQEQGVPTKLIIGPWDHLEGSSGALLPDAGLGTLSELQLRWFDHYVKGMADPTLDGDISPLTYYEQGSGDWTASERWIDTDLRATNFRLSGSAANLRPADLTTGAVTDGTSDVLPIPVAGLCTRSASQWTAGVMNQIPFSNPCLNDNAANDTAGVVFETDPVSEPIRLRGPINAKLFTESDSGDGMLSVAVEDVAPDGTVSRLTGGWQVLSHRELDESRTRELDGEIIQPYHPFTKAAQNPLQPGEIAPIDVEVFPTAAVIKPGHRLRLAVQAFDVPHLLPSVPDSPGTLTVMTIHNSAQHPSRLTIPTVGAAVTDPDDGNGDGDGNGGEDGDGEEDGDADGAGDGDDGGDGSGPGDRDDHDSRSEDDSDRGDDGGLLPDTGAPLALWWAGAGILFLQLGTGLLVGRRWTAG